MSYWTHIVSSIEIDTYIEDKNIEDLVKEKLKNAPKITGSERDADVFVNLLSGHNVSLGCDCDSCQYKDTIYFNEDGNFYCDGEQDYKCPEGEYQTRVVITVIGNLRDRLKAETKEEYKNFIKFIRKDCGFDINNKSVNIIGY